MPERQFLPFSREGHNWQAPKMNLRPTFAGYWKVGHWPVLQKTCSHAFCLHMTSTTLAPSSCPDLPGSAVYCAPAAPPSMNPSCPKDSPQSSLPPPPPQILRHMHSMRRAKLDVLLIHLPTVQVQMLKQLAQADQGAGTMRALMRHLLLLPACTGVAGWMGWVSECMALTGPGPAESECACSQPPVQMYVNVCTRGYSLHHYPTRHVPL